MEAQRSETSAAGGPNPEPEAIVPAAPAAANPEEVVATAAVGVEVEVSTPVQPPPEEEERSLLRGQAASTGTRDESSGRDERGVASPELEISQPGHAGARNDDMDWEGLEINPDDLALLDDSEPIGPEPPHFDFDAAREQIREERARSRVATTTGFSPARRRRRVESSPLPRPITPANSISAGEPHAAPELQDISLSPIPRSPESPVGPVEVPRQELAPEPAQASTSWPSEEVSASPRRRRQVSGESTIRHTQRGNDGYSYESFNRLGLFVSGPPRSLYRERQALVDSAIEDLKALHGCNRALFEDQILGIMAVPTMVLHYSDPKTSFLGPSLNYGPKHESDDRSNADRAKACALAEKMDAIRLSMLMKGFKPVAIMELLHPALFDAYQLYRDGCYLVHPRKNPINPTGISPEARGQAFLMFQKRKELARRLYGSRLASLAEDETDLGVAAVMASYGNAISRDGLPECMVEYWTRCVRLGNDEDPYGELPVLGPEMLEPVPGAPLISPNAATGRPSSDPPCRAAQAMLEGARLHEACTEEHCFMQPKHIVFEDRQIRMNGQDCYDYYSLQQALLDCKLGPGPLDLLSKPASSEDFIVLDDEDNWPTVEAKLDQCGFFSKAEDKGYLACHVQSWTVEALQKAGLIADRKPREGCFTSMTFKAIGAPILLVQSRYGGKDREYLGPRIPGRVLELLKNPKIRVNGFNIVDERRFRYLNMDVNARCDTNNYGLVAFPQEGTWASNISSNLTYLAARMGAPRVPILHQNGKASPTPPMDSNSQSVFHFYKERVDFSVPTCLYTQEMWEYLRLQSVLSLAMPLKIASAGLYRHGFDPKADVLRHAHFLSDRVRGRPGPGKLPRDELNLRPFNKVEWMGGLHTEDGIEAEWMLLRPNESRGINSIQETRDFWRLGRSYKLDFHSVEPGLARAFVAITKKPPQRANWSHVLMALFRGALGRTTPHYCGRCGSFDHLRSDCAERLKCALPLCNEDGHTIYTCTRILHRCGKCFELGHGIKHHLAPWSKPWVSQVEEATIGSMLSLRGVLRHEAFRVDPVAGEEGRIDLQISNSVERVSNDEGEETRLVLENHALVVAGHWP